MWTVEGGRPTNLFSADGGKEGGGMGGPLLGGRECGAVAFAGFVSMGRWVSVSVCTTYCTTYNGVSVRVQVGGFVQELSRLILELF